MIKFVFVSFVLILFVGVAFAEFRSSAAVKATSDYRQAKRDAQRQYVLALKKARDDALTNKDLAEANAIDAVLKQASINDPDEAQEKVPITERDLLNQKFNYYAFENATLMLRPDGSISGSREDFQGEKFWEYDGKVLKLFGPAKTHMHVELFPKRQGDLIFWVGNTDGKKQDQRARILLQSAP